MLTEIDIRVAKPKGKPYKLHDERGLYLLVTGTGARSWRFKYRVEGREKLLTLGLYPDVGLKRAREKRDDARKLVAEGDDPSVQRAAEKEARRDTFETIAREFLALLGKSGPDPDVGTAPRLR
ncbi:MAG: Arm DNA-binding domain-containing protein [Steroidobacteraceae bacterium]